MLIGLGENQFGQKFLTETCSVRSHEEATMAENTFTIRGTGILLVAIVCLE